MVKRARLVLRVVMVFMRVMTSNLNAAMKKFMKSLVLFAAAAMALTSCENEMMNEGIESNETYTLTFTADAPESRTSVSVDEVNKTASFSWSAGDKVGFYKAVNGLAQTIDNKGIQKKNSAEAVIADDGTATFTVTFDAATDAKAETTYNFAAFYPGNSWVSHASANPFNNVKVKIPSAQTLTEGTFDPKADLMMSKPHMGVALNDESIKTLEFRRLAAIGRMNLKGLTAGETITSVTVEFTDFDMAGEVTLDMENQTFVFGTANTTNAITLTGALTAAAETPVFFTCFPNNYNGDYVVTVTTESATATTIYTKDGTISKAIEFTTGNVMGFNVNLADADKQVVGKLIELDNTKRYLFKEATEMKDGWYAIVANGVAATGIASGNYGYLKVVEPITVGANISLPVASAFGFKTTEGGYTMQQYDGKYLYKSGDFDNFNINATCPSDGSQVWSVAIADGKATIKNNSVSKTISYDSAYNSFGSYATATVLPTLYELVEIDNGSYLLGVSTNELTMIGEGGEVNFNVTTYGEGTLTATANNNWLATSVDTATGTVTVTVDANNTDDVREGTITVAFAGQELTVTVSQDAPIAAGTEVEATLTFDNTSKRTIGTTEQQVWVENGITVTNNKAGSSSNVNTSYYNPVRFYKNSEVIVAAPGNISKIVFNASSAEYASNLSGAIGAEATVNDKVVTVIPTGT
ncbi:MAG: BACON domain-containing protein, partial [Tidjanibacter sp.]|nr:BACON domain-containing protein [Tidjanibacter sp.]